MKKTASILLSALLLILAGCAPAANPAGNAAPAPTAESVSVAVDNTPEPTAIPEPTQLELIQNAGKLVVATCPDYAPYEFTDSAKTGQEAFAGADISLAAYIAESLNVTLEIQSFGFDDALSAVSDGRADLAISCIAANAEREQAFEMSDAYGGKAEAAPSADATPAADAAPTADAEATAAPESASPGMVVLAKKGETELISAVNDAIAGVNRDNLYATWMDEALMLAEKLKVMG